MPLPNDETRRTILVDNSGNPSTPSPQRPESGRPADWPEWMDGIEKTLTIKRWILGDRSYYVFGGQNAHPINSVRLASAVGSIEVSTVARDDVEMAIYALQYRAIGSVSRYNIAMRVVRTTDIEDDSVVVLNENWLPRQFGSIEIVARHFGVSSDVVRDTCKTGGPNGLAGVYWERDYYHAQITGLPSARKKCSEFRKTIRLIPRNQTYGGLARSRIYRARFLESRAWSRKIIPVADHTESVLAEANRPVINQSPREYFWKQAVALAESRYETLKIHARRLLGNTRGDSQISAMPAAIDDVVNMDGGVIRFVARSARGSFGGFTVTLNNDEVAAIVKCGNGFYAKLKASGADSFDMLFDEIRNWVVFGIQNPHLVAMPNSGDDDIVTPQPQFIRQPGGEYVELR